MTGRRAAVAEHWLSPRRSSPTAAVVSTDERVPETTSGHGPGTVPVLFVPVDGVQYFT